MGDVNEAAVPILTLTEVEAAYDRIIIALRGVTLEVPERGVVALLGGNGAGKTSTLKAVSGLLGAERGAVTAGEIRFRGRSVTHDSARSLVRAGLVQVLEGRRCFPHFSVEENLVSGALVRRTSHGVLRAQLERIYTYFPRLRRIRRSLAGYASGGEQQMVAIGRALMTQPKLLLLDEPSMGLAPQVVDEIFRIIRTLNREEGVSFLLAEQNARMALRHADHGYVLENGRVVASGTAAELGARGDVQAFYLGVGAKRLDGLHAKRGRLGHPNRSQSNHLTQERNQP